MPTLHIEHPISDFPTWASAFGRFAGARREAGVREESIRRPVDNPKFIVIDLEFDSIDEAEAFLHFLRTEVWAVPGNSPALAGSPETMILEPAG